MCCRVPIYPRCDAHSVKRPSVGRYKVGGQHPDHTPREPPSWRSSWSRCHVSVSSSACCSWCCYRHAAPSSASRRPPVWTAPLPPAPPARMLRWETAVTCPAAHPAASTRSSPTCWPPPTSTATWTAMNLGRCSKGAARSQSKIRTSSKTGNPINGDSARWTKSSGGALSTCGCWRPSRIGCMSCGSTSGTWMSRPRTPPTRTSPSLQRRTVTVSASPTTLETLETPLITTTAGNSRPKIATMMNTPKTVRITHQAHGGTAFAMKATLMVCTQQKQIATALSIGIYINVTTAWRRPQWRSDLHRSCKLPTSERNVSNVWSYFLSTHCDKGKISLNVF